MIRRDDDGDWIIIEPIKHADRQINSGVASGPREMPT
jgi:hypothetical protein